MPEQDDFDFLEEDASRLAQQSHIIAAHPDLPTDAEGKVEGLVIPMLDVVILPKIMAPYFLYEGDPLVKSLTFARQQDENIIAIFYPEGENTEFLPIGVEMAISEPMRLHNDSIVFLMQGRRRILLENFYTDEDEHIFVNGTPIDEDLPLDDEAKKLMRLAAELFVKNADYNTAIQDEMLEFASQLEDIGWLADFIITAEALSYDEMLDFLLTPDPLQRLQKVIDWLRQTNSAQSVKDSIDTRVQAEMNRNQREFYLREQLRVIKKELGETDIWTQDANELKERIEKADLPDHVRAAAQKEAERLAQMPPMAPETGIIRTYLDWLLELPWNKLSEDNLDVKHAAKVLEKAHHGLKKPKERILEYIAVRSLKPEGYRQPILCFVGPPGTGKTSLGKSIAEALGRQFVRVSLGGVRDEAEIRGHRRTYIGAMPGRIIQTIRRAGTANPLFMLDEIDKLGHDFRGDPASALLEVLDPQQNNAFSDHYLDLPFDLSRVMFITTANSLDTIPPALLDRMEVIEFSGYIEEEKLAIAHKFLIPRQMKENGVQDLGVSISDGALKRIIREYTYEAGVRNLERTIGTLCRKIARAKAEGKTYPKQITAAMLEKLLGPPDYHQPETEKEDQIGVVTGLAWTANGGEVMPVEVAVYDGKGNVQMTGQLGEVMQESIQAALTYLKTRAAALDIPFEVFDRMDIHIHLPEAAIPKDGPSAGITLCTAIASALTGRPVWHHVAMTGEITLRGRILPIGGLREKILAAYRHGITTVLIPHRNQKDVHDLPAAVKKSIKIVPVKHMDEVLRLALAPEATIAPPRPRPQDDDEED